MKNILLFAIVLITSCDPEPICIKRYQFEFPAQIYPAQDTFNRGDTIWYELNIANEIEDVETREWFDISMLDLYFNMYISRFDTLHINSSYHHFDYVLMEGEQQFISTGSIIQFENIDNKYFKVGLIPNHRGGYRISTPIPHEFRNVNTGAVDFDDECKEGLAYSTVVINNDDNNTELLEGLYQISEGDTDTLFFGDEQSLIETGRHNYVFYVR